MNIKLFLSGVMAELKLQLNIFSTFIKPTMMGALLLFIVPSSVQGKNGEAIEKSDFIHTYPSMHSSVDISAHSHC